MSPNTDETDRSGTEAAGPGSFPGGNLRDDQYEEPRIAAATVDAVKSRSLAEHWKDGEGVGGKLKALVSWFSSTRIGRANARVGNTKANLQAGGVAYNALFSLFAALTVGVTAVMVALGSFPEFRDQVIDGIAEAVPGIIDAGSGGLLKPEDLMMDTALNPTTLIAAGVAVFAAIAMMTALKSSMRTVAGIVTVPENFVIGKLRDLAGFVVLGVTIVLTSILTVAVQGFGEQVFDWIGIESTGLTRGALTAAAVGVTFLMDMALLAFLIRPFASIRAKKRDLLMGVFIGGIISAVLRAAGTAVIRVPDNAIMASATAIVTLLLLVNLLVRVVLMVTAFTVNPPAPIMPESNEEVHFSSVPNYVTVSAPETLEWDHDPATGVLVPDPQLNPEYEPEPEPEPRWGGLIGRLKRARMERLERKLERSRESYYR